MPTAFQSIFTVEDCPETLEGWHAHVCSGVSVQVLKNVAKLLNVPEKHIAGLVLETPGMPRKGVLSREAADFAYRFAKAWGLLTQKGWAPTKSAAWLKEPCPLLKGRIPLLLLTTHQGQEYVMTAIQRS